MKKISSAVLEPTPFNDEMLAHNPEMIEAALRVFKKLPKEFQKFMAERCAFVSVGDYSPSSVTHLALNPSLSPAIGTGLLVITLYDEIPEQYKDITIAGCVAQAWIGANHSLISPETLLTAWGFDLPCENPPMIH